MMTTLPLADCSRMLGIHPKTLRHWLKQAGVPLAAHSRDARIKCVTEEDLQQVARLHGDRLRSLRLAAAAASLQAKTGAEIAMMANVIAGRASASAAKADEKKAWDEGMAMPMEEAVRYALQRNS